MYLTHYNIDIMPFELSPDPKFIWLSEKHKEALAVLKFGFKENKGFVLLTGDIGTGKTTLINCFLNENDTDSIITAVPDPDLSIEDFFSLLSMDFGFKIDFKTRGEFLLRFKDFLEQTYSDQKKVLLIIDEAQMLNQQLLEQLRLLSNIEKQDGKLFCIYLVGQNDLHERLMNDQNKALRQRIAVHCHVEPLTEAETRDYINHRMRVAGSKKEIFSREAISEIFSFSKGCPRLINTICDRALLTGYAQDKNQLDLKIIQKCADELALPGEKEHALEKSVTEEKKENQRKTTADKPGTNVRKDGDRPSPEKNPDTEVKKENNRETDRETLSPHAEKEKNHEQAAEAPLPAAGTEGTRQAAAGAPVAEADRNAQLEATDPKPQTGAAGPVQFTWGPGADPEPLWVSVNDQKPFSGDKSTLSPRTIMAAVAILMLTAVALYLWLGA